MKTFASMLLALALVQESPLSHTMEEGFRAGTLRVTSDGARFAYVVAEAGRQYGVVDGERTEAFDEIAALEIAGKRTALVGRGGAQVIPVVDGKKMEAVEALKSLSLSADGRRFAYAARSGGNWRVIVDGAAGEEFEEISEGPRFSPDGKKWLCVAERAGKSHLVVDGASVAVGESIWDARFSAGGRRLAWGLTQGIKLKVMVDGRRAAEGEAIDVFNLSPDGKRIAWTAMDRDSNLHLFVDGARMQTVGCPRQVELAGGRVAYLTEKDGNRFCAVVDGKVGPEYDGVSGLQFSPDAKCVAYVGRRGAEEILVVNGREIERAELVGFVTFAGDSRQVRFARVREGELTWRSAGVE